MKILCKWSGRHLWGTVAYNGLALCHSGNWLVIDGTLGIINSKEHSADDLISKDNKWSAAFELILDGLKPDWRECSCGTQSVMGDNWKAHPDTCETIKLSSPFAPKNNDGRRSCYKCWEGTRQAGGGMYSVCKNKNCDWYDK